MRNRELAEGGLISGIFIVLFILTIYTPIGIISIYVLPAPFIIYSFRNGIRASFGVVFVNIVLAMIFASIYGLFIGIVAGTVGITMGALYKRYESLHALAGGSIVAIGNIVLSLGIISLLFGVDIVQDVKEQVLQYLNSMEGILYGVGDQKFVEQFMNDYRNLFNNLDLIIPFIIIIFSVLIALINHLVSSILLKRMGAEINNLPPFRDWSFPKSIFYYYFLTIVVLMTPFANIDFLKIILANLYPFLQLVLLIQGLSFVFYYAFLKRKGRVLPTIAIISLFIPLLSQVIHLIGIFDLGLNLRQKLKV